MMDIKTAFLQGKKLQRDVFVKPPKEAKVNKNNIWKLHKCVYGLNEASKYWYNRIDDELLKLNMIRNKYDTALYIYKVENNCLGFLSLHVDDILYTGESVFIENVVNKLKSVFIIGSEDSFPLKYLGIILKDHNNSLSYSQQTYIENAEYCDIITLSQKDRMLNNEEQSSFRAICGQLNWIASQSRPDLAFEVNQLCKKLITANLNILKDE